VKGKVETSKKETKPGVRRHQVRQDQKYRKSGSGKSKRRFSTNCTSPVDLVTKREETLVRSLPGSRIIKTEGTSAGLKGGWVLPVIAIVSGH